VILNKFYFSDNTIQPNLYNDGSVEQKTTATNVKMSKAQKKNKKRYQKNKNAAQTTDKYSDPDAPSSNV
jgi:hypothetical protein